MKSGRRFGLSLVLVLYLIMEAWAAPERSPDILSVRKTGAISACVKAMGLDLLMEKDGRIFIVAGPHDAARLSALDIPFTIETPRFAPAAAGDVRIAGGTNGAFHTYAELEADLKALESAHPGIVKVYSIGTSLENRTIYAVKISDNVAADEDEAEVLFLGCHHAREWISVEVPFQLARYLAGSYDRDAGIRDLVDRSEIWIVPLVNPDGLEYSINVYRYWRKNRRANADGSFGVDVNRNYGFMWGYDNEGSSPEPSSEIYRGTAPFSEPESRAVRDLFLSRPFRALVSYHSYAQSILYPWSFIDAPTDRDALLGGLGLDMADLIEAVNGRAYTVGRGAAALYTTNGDTTDWAFGIAGIPAYTIELPPMNAYLGGFVNAENDIDGVFRENLPAMLRVLGYAVAVPATTQASGANRARDREKSRVMDKNARPVK